MHHCMLQLLVFIRCAARLIISLIDCFFFVWYPTTRKWICTNPRSILKLEQGAEQTHIIMISLYVGRPWTLSVAEFRSTIQGTVTLVMLQESMRSLKGDDLIGCSYDWMIGKCLSLSTALRLVLRMHYMTFTMLGNRARQN